MVVEIKCLDLFEAFASFANAIEKKEYEKMPYRDYRRFYDAMERLDDKDVLFLHFLNEQIHISIPTNQGTYINDAFTLNIQDGSFGTFLKRYCDEHWCNMKKDNYNKEKKNMKNMFNFDFGPCDSENLRMSLYGIAVKNTAGVWVSYIPTEGKIMDVDIMNFSSKNFLYKMPVAVTDVRVGDVVVHNRVPVFVTKVNENSFSVVDVRAGENKDVIPTANMFGFNFMTKVVSVLDMTGMGAPSAAQPFGNALPFLMMMDENASMEDILPLMMMGGNMGQMNPMMMYFVMSQSNGSDSNSDKNFMLPLLMMQMFTPQLPFGQPQVTAPAPVNMNPYINHCDNLQTTTSANEEAPTV